MPFFICLNLLISYAVNAHNQLERLFLSINCEYLGIALIVIGCVCISFAKLSLAQRYELFCSGTVLVWISTWPPNFNADSPVIFFFPLFFCLVTVLVHKVFILQAESIDLMSLKYIAALGRHNFWHTGVLVVSVIVSLTQIEHYRVYPSLLSLLLIKYAVLSILELRAEDLVKATD